MHTRASDNERCRREERIDILEMLTSSTRFRTWTTILVRTLFIDDLREGEWLVIAPTEAAFARLGRREVERLFDAHDVEPLIDLAEHCIKKLDVVREPATRGVTFRLPTSLSRGATVVDRLACSNGLICAVDRVVLPTIPE